MKEMLVLTVRKSRPPGILVVALIASLTGGCSSVPDAVNPVEWYKGASDWISGDDKVAATKETKAKQAEAKPVPGADKPFPKLDTVPARPPRSTAAEREDMANSLIADRDRARYSDEQIRRQNGSSATSSLTQAASFEPTVSAPAPAPVVPTAPNQMIARPGNSSSVVVPQDNRVPQVATIPNQPIPVNPNQVPSSIEVSPPPQPVQLPDAPSIAPPPPPVVVGSNAPLESATSQWPLENQQRPPAVNPSGGGPSFSRPAPSIQRGGTFHEADRFAPRFPNEVGLPQRPVVEAPTFETAQFLRPTSSPVATILFADGSARIGRVDRQTIRQVYNEYRTRGGRIHVVGHASSRTRNLDQVSHQLANFRISYERARSVATVFERLGVSPEAIVVTALSDQEPTYFEVMPAGEAGNRRVEIFFEN
jgi:flagellar motor protein MotB